MFAPIHPLPFVQAFLICACTLVSLSGHAAEKDKPEPFGIPSVAAEENHWGYLWRDLQTEMRAEAPIIAQCGNDPGKCPSEAAGKFVSIVREGESKEGIVRLGYINRAVNLAIRFKEGTRWTSPFVTLSTGIGDCKHYALVKYAALNASGVQLENLRIVVVRIRSLRSQHMVLAVYGDERWLVLDNRTLELVDSRDLADYEPLYSFDHRGMQQFVLPKAEKIARALCQAAG